MGDAAGQGPEAFHFLCLDQLLFETFTLGVVKEITLELGQLAGFIEAPDKLGRDVDGVTIALLHLKLVTLRTFVRANAGQQLSAFVFGM